MEIVFRTNIDKVARLVGKKPEAISRGLSMAIKKSAFLVERYSKQFTPVITGRLRGSIASDIYPKKAIIAPHTEYATIVHEGLGRRIPKPYMTRGKQAALPEIKEVFKSELRRAIL